MTRSSQLWAPTRRRSTSPGSSRTPGRRRSGPWSTRRRSAGRRVTPSPARPSRWSQPNRAGSRPRAPTPRSAARSSEASAVGAAGWARTPSAALGLVLAGEGHLSEAERELASAEHLFRDEVATLQHTWVLLQLATDPLPSGATGRGRDGDPSGARGDGRASRVRVRLGARPARSSASWPMQGSVPTRASCSHPRARRSLRCSGCSTAICR